MSPRRRAVLLGGLAILLGTLAAADVAGRERALERRLGPSTQVVVAREAVPAGRRLTAAGLAVRTVPARYAPAGVITEPGAVAGLRAAVPIPAGADLVASLVDDGARPAARGAPVRPGERVADLIATGSPQLVTPGSHVDVLVTRGSDGGGRTVLALEDVEVLAAAAGHSDAGGPKVAVSLRVTLRQAVYLAAAQSFARDIRLLPRAASDRGRGDAGLAVGAGL